MKRNAVFLSGWEYNRLLQEDPLLSRQSALPLSVFWNGAAQFWLFEKVYCTREALDCEVAATETLDWASGRIFQDLHRRDFIHTIDLGSLRGTEEANEIVTIHDKLRRRYSEPIILSLLRGGNDIRLDWLTLQLLKPLLDRLGCLATLAPNSMARWYGQRPSLEAPAFGEALSALMKAVDLSSSPMRAGITLCDPPGTGLAPEIMAKLIMVQNSVEQPMIPDLLAGRMAQKDFLAALVPNAKVYGPINEQLWTDYKRNIERLERLRDAAKAHIWRKLHGDWIPQLEEDPSFAKTFQGLLRDALLRSAFDPWLEWITNLTIAVTTIAVGGTAGPIAGAITAGTLHEAHVNIRRKSNELTVFFQEARQQRGGG